MSFKKTLVNSRSFQSICLLAFFFMPLFASIADSEIIRFDFSPSFLEEIKAQTEAARKKVLVPQASGTSDIWANSVALDGLKMADGSSPESDTTVRITHDTANLYLAIECDIPRDVALPSLSAEPKSDDSLIFNNDHLELWFKTSAGHTYQFVIGANGNIYDLRNKAAGYNPDWKHVIRHLPHGWLAELTVPLAALELQAWPVELPFNIGRNGPYINLASWSGSYSETAQSSLFLDGAEDSPAQDSKVSDVVALGAGAALKTKIQRSYARPGERWISVDIELPLFESAGFDYLLQAAVFPLNGREPAAELATIPARAEGKVYIDLRSLNLNAARLSLNLIEGGQSIAACEFFLTAHSPTSVLTAGDKIKVFLDEPEGISAPDSWPVTFGVPFPAGALWDVRQLSLVDGAGRQLPCQIEPSALWAPEGAVKWARIDALVNPGDGCYVVVNPAAGAVGPQLRLEEQNDHITIDTGAAVYILGKGKSPIIEIKQAGKTMADTRNTRGLYVIDQNGRLGSAAAEDETMIIEAVGPIASCVRFEGYYKTAEGENLARHITRVENFAGQASARITHTLVLSESTLQVWLKDIGWEFAVDSGGSAVALFGTSLSEPLACRSYPLSGDASVYMLQDSHYAFVSGSNHFVIARADSGETLFEGEECGEFAGLRGARGGLVAGCRDAALQHPKEFEISADKIVLRLFSNRAGDELDFRSPALIKLWDLENWYKAVLPRNYLKDIPKLLENVSNTRSDAVGWAKTHDLFIAPLPGTAAAGEAEVANLAGLHNRQVYALIDPQWSHRSDVFGPLHPKDSENFPLIEDYLDSAFRVWERRMEDFGYYGFMYYFAGPHLRYKGKYVDLYRYAGLLTYTLRPDLWRAYVRSGDRSIREFSERSNRTFADSTMCHWEGAGKTYGLFLGCNGSDTDRSVAANLPFHWMSFPIVQVASTSDMNNFLYHYYLTGSRRAKDFVEEYAVGAKAYWTPEKARRVWRGIMYMRMMVQAYSLTWDPDLLELVEATTDTFEDKAGAIGLSKDRPYRSSTYKTRVDVLALKDAWEITGNPRYHKLLNFAGRFWWTKGLGEWPLFYVNNQGLIGDFLYRETGNPAIVEMLALQMRQALSRYDDETGIPEFSAEKSTFVFQGIPYTQELAKRSGADKQCVASWVAYDDFSYPVSIVAQKADYEILKIEMRTEGKASELNRPGSTGGIAVRPVGIGTTSGLDLNRVLQQSEGVAYIEIPKDAPEGAYEILTPPGGFTIAVADRIVPMVVYAPKYWRPAPPQRPAVKWYFKVLPDSPDAQIFFEYPAQLFDPEGQVWQAQPAQSGWIDLPADQPGLWSFEPAPGTASAGLVRVKNLPPFFAVRDPNNYFEPPIAWERQAKHQAPEEPEAGSVYVAGVANQALYLDGKRTFVLQDQEVEGKSILPFQEGTIEFFFKPAWSTFDLPQDINKRLFTMNVVTGEPWVISYTKSSEIATWTHSHILYNRFFTDGPNRRISASSRRQTIFEGHEWVHLAWVWGPHETPIFVGKDAHRKLRTCIYINGRQGKQQFLGAGSQPGNVAVDQPREIVVGRGVLAALDELRVSGVQRYRGDFVPPDRALELDEDTLVLFRFDGDCVGETFLPSESAVVAELQ